MLSAKNLKLRQFSVGENEKAEKYKKRYKVWCRKQKIMEPKFYLKKKDKDGVSTVYLCLICEKKQLYCSTGLKIKEKDWDKKRQMAKKNEEVNARLSFLKRKAENFIKLFNDISGITPNDLKSFLFTNEEKKKIENVDRQSFFAVIDNFIDNAPNRLNADGERITWQRVRMYMQERRALDQFQKHLKQKLDFQMFDKNVITDFQNFLTEKGLANNTIVRYIRLLFVFFRYAEDNFDIPVNQAFRKYKTHTNRTDSVVLSEKEIEQIWEYEPANRREKNVKNLFIIGLHTGLRFSDYSRLQQDDIDFNKMTISVIQQKTGQSVTLPLHPRLAAMLMEEGLPKPISNQKFNLYLKDLMKSVGFTTKIQIKKIIGGKRITEYVPKYELIGSHTARRSFATNLYIAGVNPSVIMCCTGHRDLKTFMNYVHITNEDKINIVRNIWNAASVK